jgi:hypothetical protein
MQRYATDPRGPLHEFEHLKSVSQAKELSPRSMPFSADALRLLLSDASTVWTNIQSEVLGFMNATIRPKCRVDGQIRTLCDRVKCLVAALEARPTSYAPRVIDLYSLDSIRSVLDRLLENGEDTVTVDSFAEALADYDAVIEHYEAQRRAELLQAFKPGPGEDDNANTWLHLATTAFSCDTDDSRYWCHVGQMDVGEALAHRCAHSEWSLYGPRFGEREWRTTDRLQQVKLACADVLGAGSSSAVVFSTDTKRQAIRVVQLAGLDPASAMAADMDSANAWFQCTSMNCDDRKCSAKSALMGNKIVYSWRQAVSARRRPT